MTTKDKLARRKLSLLELTQDMGNVSRTHNNDATYSFTGVAASRTPVSWHGAGSVIDGPSA